MVSLKIIGVILLPFLSGTLALPAPQDQTTGVDLTTEVDWVPVAVINGTQIYVNSAAILDTSVNPSTKVIRSLSRPLGRRGVDDRCGNSSFNSHPGPFAPTADCWDIYNYANSLHNSPWQITGTRGAQQGIMWAGDCRFYAGTMNVWLTYIGPEDIRDLTRDGINKWQSGGWVAAQGEMGCDNSNRIWSGTSLTYWTIMRY